MLLSNRFWNVCFSKHKPYIQELMFDSYGNSNFCKNMLKTKPIGEFEDFMSLIGAQTGYMNSEKQLFCSKDGCNYQISQPDADHICISGIEYGKVVEDWDIKLDGNKFIWQVKQTWKDSETILDSFIPGFFFSARKDHGNATVFQIWDKDLVQDDYYRNEHSKVIVGGTPETSRMCKTHTGHETMMKLYSNANPNGDLAVSPSGFLKKAELLNFMSMIGQGMDCEVTKTTQVKKNQEMLYNFVFTATHKQTGLHLDLDVNHTYGQLIGINNQFYDRHVNCAIMADTKNGYFGNEPSGYVALFCQYMYSEMIKFGVLKDPLGTHSMHALNVLINEVTDMAKKIKSSNELNFGYQTNTSLDILPSFLLTVRNLFVITGHKLHQDLIQDIFDAAFIACQKILDDLEEYNGLIFATRTSGNDYWDWLRRDGYITSINVLTFMSLDAFIEISEWMNHKEMVEKVKMYKNIIYDRFNDLFWDDHKGCYADWIDSEGNKRFFLYTGPQLQAITSGLVPLDRAQKILKAIDMRRDELGDDWSKCFSIQTNLFDALEFTGPYMDGINKVTDFGQTMNGGCLLSWNYYWMGALVICGEIAKALKIYTEILDRFNETSLMEGCNYWDYSGKPSRTATEDYPYESYEPFLSDQGLVSVAFLRWFLGINPTLSSLEVNPNLPLEWYPIKYRIYYLGELNEIKVGEKTSIHVVEDAANVIS